MSATVADMSSGRLVRSVDVDADRSWRPRESRVNVGHMVKTFDKIRLRYAMHTAVDEHSQFVLDPLLHPQSVN